MSLKSLHLMVIAEHERMGDRLIPELSMIAISDKAARELASELHAMKLMIDPTTEAEFYQKLKDGSTRLFGWPVEVVQE